jgi:hypothetical protein
MAETVPRLVSTIAVREPPLDKHEGVAQTISAFLAWLETDKGLRLCEAFKPQYDWYSPVAVSHKCLARQFLRDAPIDQTKRELRA